MGHIHQALLKVQKAIIATGIEKSRRNQEQRFNFRGIDDALAAFAPLLADAGILLSPSYSDLTIDARPTKSGGTTDNARVSGTYTFTSAEDGSTHVVGPFYGEANDGQDKAISKATSIAERNMFFLTFVVPHEPAIGGDPDEHGEPESPEYDVGPWMDKIDGAANQDELAAIAGEIKESKIPDRALRNIRARWSQRANAIKAAA